jgi:hypothetical protein
MNDVNQNQPRLEADLDSYIRALTLQRNNALDMVAQMEGVIGALQKEIAKLRTPQEPPATGPHLVASE